MPSKLPIIGSLLVLSGVPPVACGLFSFTKEKSKKLRTRKNSQDRKGKKKDITSGSTEASSQAQGGESSPDPKKEA